MFFNPYLAYLLNNTVKDYIWAAGVFAATIVLFHLLKIIVIKRLSKWAEKTKTDLDNVIIKAVRDIGFLFYLFLGLQIALQFVEFPPILERIVYYVTLIIAVYYITKGSSYIIAYGVKAVARANDRDENASIVQILVKFSKAVLWIIAFLLVLSNLGYNITSLLAGVGIGGIAIAFALQNILEDLFSAFSIYFDKPFEPGDFIIVEKDKGTVQNIGLKSTRLKTLQGEELIVSNKELTKARVHNYKKMKKRRQTFGFGVTYDTKSKTLKEIPTMVKEIINDIGSIKFDRAYFTEFGDSSLKFEVVYRVDSAEYEEALSAQQEINLKLHQKFNQENIEMAFPTQTIHLEK